MEQREKRICFRSFFCIFFLSFVLMNSTVSADAAKVGLNYTKVTVAEGNKSQLKLQGTKEKVTWKTSKKQVADVSKTGLVTGKTAGQATISAVVGKKVYRCQVTVKTVRKELSSEQIYQKASKSTVEITVYDKEGQALALGSGFFIDKNRIVTNYHVIQNGASIEVATYDKKNYKVTGITAYDKDKDIVILAVSTSYTPLTLWKKGVVTGEKIYTLGSSQGLTGTFSDGVVSTASRVLNGIKYIQITAPISKGNSGGPLLNKYGEAVGINTLCIVDGQNLNFALNLTELDKLKVTKPVPVAQVTKGDKQEENEPWTIKEEDETLSSDLEICQELGASEIMMGSLVGDSTSDYYYLKIEEESSVAVILGTIGNNDYKKVNIQLLDENGKIIPFEINELEVEGSYGYQVKLPVGDYYLHLMPKPENAGEAIQYQLSVGFL